MPTPKGGTSPRRAPVRLVRPDERPAKKMLPKPLPPLEHLPDEAKAIWQWLAGLEQVRAVVTVADVLLLEAICTKVMMRRRALRALEDRGGALSYESVTEGGGAIERPYTEPNLIIQLDRQLGGELGRLGLSPADRSRVISTIGGASKKADPIGEFTG